MHCTARADYEIVFFSKRAESLADAHVVVRIEARVHGDECCWWAAVGKHADEDEICIVDPIEIGISGNVEAGVFEEGDASFAGLEIGVEFVVDVF